MTFSQCFLMFRRGRHWSHPTALTLIPLICIGLRYSALILFGIKYILNTWGGTKSKFDFIKSFTAFIDQWAVVKICIPLHKHHEQHEQQQLWYVCNNCDNNNNNNVCMQVGMWDCSASRDDRLVNRIGQTIVIWMYVITVTTATVTTTTM